MGNNSTNIIIRDPDLAAALLMAGFRLKDTQCDVDSRSYYLFRKNKKLINAIESYWACAIADQVRKYFDNARML